MSKVKVETVEGVAIVTLSDPATMNAAGVDLIIELTETFRRLAAGEIEARSVVITGEGRGFCSGANLSGGGAAASAREAPADGAPRQNDAGSALETHYNPFITLLRDFPLPIVTAVNGPAAGVGCSLALMGDLIVAGESAYFLQAFRRIGLVPDCGSTWILPRLIGRARAIELSLLGERLPAEKALEWGLVNRVVDDAALAEETQKLAHDLANGPTIALSLIRRLYWESPENSFEQQIDMEKQSQVAAGRTEDFKEGIAAFLEKRPAKFKGR